MAVISRDLGPVTAYAAAVNRGYTGTREEFETLMASYATVAQEAGESASAAADSASDAESSASEAATSASDASSFASAAYTSAGNASNAATAAGIAQTAAESAKDAAQSAQTAAEAAQEGAEAAVDGFDTAVTQAISDVNAAGTNQKELAKRQAEKSEAWAVGKINGEDVGVSDPAYHNNAKYYAESAGTSANTATTKAGEAAQSASGAAASASAAAASAQTLVIDDTLTQPGQAADAKATGNKINELKNELNPYHAALETGAMASGKDVTNNDAVRTKGYIVAPTGTVIGAEKYNNKNYVIYFYFYDKDYNYLSDAALNISNAKSITVPSGVTFIRFFAWVVPGLVDEVTEEFKTALSACISVYSETGIQSNRQAINEIIADVEDIKNTNPIMETGAMVNGNPSPSTSAVRFAEYYLTQPGDKIYISKYENKNWTANFYYYDKQFNYLSFVTLNTANGTFVTVPENTRYIRFFAWAVSGLVPAITEDFLKAFSKCVSFTIDDYLLNRLITENADRITAIESSDTPPTYYIDQLTSITQDIVSHAGSVGKMGASFVFITDVHWDRNYKNSPSLLQKVIEKTPINKIIMGGDYFSQFENSKQTAIDTLSDCMNKFKNKAAYVFPIFGNHDRNSNHNGSADVYLSKAETFALINSWLYLGVKYGDYFDFFVDDDKNKTRYICLDTGAQFIDGGEIDNASLTWMQSVINELSSDWHVIIFAHWLFSPTTWNQPLVDGVLTGSYTQSAQTLFAMLDENNADPAKAKVEGVITGHTHCDYDDETTGGIPIVYTDTDSRDAHGEYTATAGTVSEQCFDVITFDYINKKIYCDRVGRGSSRVISY